MPKRNPLEGIRLLGTSTYGKPGYANELQAVVVHNRKKYIYDKGTILGPITDFLGSPSISYRGREDGSQAPHVLLYRYRGRFGVFVNGVKHPLFDELKNFGTRGGQLVYEARKGEKWAYVVDGVVHGWYDELNSEKLGFRPSTGELYYWARNEGKDSFFLDDLPLGYFDAVSDLCLRGDEVMFVFTQVHPALGPHQIPWVNGDLLDPFWAINNLRWVDGGSYAFVGVEHSKEWYFFNGQEWGPFDDVRPRDSTQLYRGQEVEVPYATFSLDGKESVLVGDWQSPWHGKIQDVGLTDGHLKVRATDGKERSLVSTVYVDGKLVCALPGEHYGHIEGNKISFTVEGKMEIPI